MSELASEPSAPRESAARSYKKVVAELTASADRLRELDRERAAELSWQLVAVDAEMLRACEDAELTRQRVDEHWEAALKALWVESWMKLRLRPGPDPSAEPADLAALDDEVGERVAALKEAVRRRRFGLPRR